MLLPSPPLTILLFKFLTHSLFFTSSFAARRVSTASQSQTGSHLSARDGESPCAQFFRVSDQSVFLAQDAYNCLTSMPFNKTVASQFLQYYKDTIEFQSTLTYLKNPPPSYQQPRVDLLSALDLVGKGIATGIFRDEYAFEVAVQNVVQAAHDSHVKLDAGVLNVFRFGSPKAISSVSMDGIEVPKVYFTDDLARSQVPGADWKPSAIKSICNRETTEWLTDFASYNSFGLLEPNADWNALMYSPAADIQNKPSVFTGQSPFYPGDKLDFVLENGTHLPTRWRSLASVLPDTPTINNGEDAYSFFVLNTLPSTSQEAPLSANTSPPPSTSTSLEISPSSTITSTPDLPSSQPNIDTPTSWVGVPAYPSNPDVVQHSLGYGGFITGYFLNESSVAVLSIPSFEMTGSALSSFSVTVGRFLQRSKRAGLKKVVIDLQQNYGGEVLLAIDAFKQFFPSKEPFGGSRLRSSAYSNALGNTFTKYQSRDTLNSADTAALIDTPWAILDYVDAGTKKNFTSWLDFYGPHEDRRDFFSKVQQYNVSSSLFDEVATGGYLDDGVSPAGITIYGYGNRSTSASAPYAPEDIIILTDSVCHSSCAIFVEMMHHEAGVKTVVVGGRPNIGPMQAVAGTRGALDYSTIQLDNDMYTATNINSSVTNDLPQSHVTESPLFWVTNAGINLRDQIREGEKEYFPQQFAYEAADCRIYWTYASFNNFRNLWQHAADAIWTKPELCVADSTNFHPQGATDTLGPSSSQKGLWSSAKVEQHQQTGGTGFGNAAKNNGIASGDAGGKQSTLNSACVIGQRPSTCATTNEVCLEVGSCRKGIFVFSAQCKRQCTSSRQCVASQQPNFCNIFDQYCRLGPDGRSQCMRLRDQKAFQGSGSQQSTSGPLTGGQFISALSGFCEQRVKTDVSCLNWSVNYPGLPKASVAALAQSAISTIILDTPEPPENQGIADKSPIEGGTPGAAIMNQFNH